VMRLAAAVEKLGIKKFHKKILATALLPVRSRKNLFYTECAGLPGIRTC